MASEGTTEGRTNGRSARVLPAPWRSPASFIAAIAQGETAALRALYLFYVPLLRDQARQLGTPADERAELVTTVLDDFVLHVQSDAVVPYDVARYLVAAVRNRIRTQHRGRLRARALHERAYSTTASSGQRIVAESHSEFSLRSAQPSADDTAGSLSTAITKLAEWSALMLRPEELVLMIGVSRHVPLRDVAKQLGISYAAARVRVHRLRERFRTLVLQHVATLDAKEKREVERFLRRAGLCLESRVERGRKG